MWFGVYILTFNMATASARLLVFCRLRQMLCLGGGVEDEGEGEGEGEENEEAGSSDGDGDGDSIRGQVPTVPGARAAAFVPYTAEVIRNWRPCKKYPVFLIRL